MPTDFDPDERFRENFDVREMQREVEAAEAQLERNTRPLSDVFIEFMEVGDSIEVAVGEHRFTGAVMGVSSDLVAIEGDGGQCAVVALSQLTFARVVAAKAGPGRPYAPMNAETAVALLRNLAGARAGTLVEVVGRDLGRLMVTVAAVSGTHAELTTDTGQPWVVPIESIGALVTGMRLT